MLKIGNVEIKHPIIMAPMAGITNVAYRRLVKEFGAGLVVSKWSVIKRYVMEIKRQLICLQ